MKKLSFFFITVIIMFVISCQQDNTIDEKLTIPTHVYVAGAENNQACYWKDNVKHILTGGTGYVAKKITVNNNNVYVYGSGPNYQDCFWKNGVKYDIAQYLNLAQNSILANGMPTSFAVHDFYINNDDIYILMTRINTSGNIQFSYWKNGVETILNGNSGDFMLPSISLPDAFRSGLKNYITVHNSKVYVLGNQNNVAGYFENSTFHTTNSPISEQYRFSSIVSNNSKIFILLNNPSRTLDLHNNSIITYNFATSTQDSDAYAITLDQNDIYYYKFDQYWKNNNSPFLTNDPAFPYFKRMVVKNGISYSIRSSGIFSNNLKLSIGNTQIMSNNGNSSIIYNDIFVD